ncbi:hypothetical protein BC939DRAFT_287691, partial [Gamsiella multidivaricata]|uniref:uncharacterized protein n=1 Tax=Gamsiella multidivaricata TaxID=101098 RepID=UPI00221FF329
ITLFSTTSDSSIRRRDGYEWERQRSRCVRPACRHRRGTRPGARGAHAHVRPHGACARPHGGAWRRNGEHRWWQRPLGRQSESLRREWAEEGTGGQRSREQDRQRPWGPGASARQRARFRWCWSWLA